MSSFTSQLFLRSFSPAEVKSAGSKVQLYEVTQDFSYQSDKLGVTITVPAGTFKNCVVVAGHYMMPVMADVITGMEMVPINQKEWYCPEAGMVKFIRAESIVSRLVLGGTTVMELVNLSR